MDDNTTEDYMDMETLDEYMNTFIQKYQTYQDINQLCPQKCFICHTSYDRLQKEGKNTVKVCVNTDKMGFCDDCFMKNKDNLMVVVLHRVGKPETDTFYTILKSEEIKSVIPFLGVWHIRCSLAIIKYCYECNEWIWCNVCAKKAANHRAPVQPRKFRDFFGVTIIDQYVCLGCYYSIDEEDDDDTIEIKEPDYA